MGVQLREKELAKGRTRFYLDIYHNKKRYYEFLFVAEKGEKTEKWKLAQTIASQRYLELMAIGTEYIPKHKQNTLLLDYFKIHIEKYIKADKRLVECAFTKLEEYMHNNNISNKITFQQLDTNFFLGFSEYLKYKAGLKGETPLNYWKKFKSMIIKAKNENLIKSSVYEKVTFSLKGQDARKTIQKDILNEEDVKALKLTDCGNDEVKRAFLFATYTGLGLAEIHALKWSNIIGNTLVKKREKTDIEIENKLSKYAISLLGERKGKDDFVFNLRNRYTHKPLSSNGINKVLATWVRKAGITSHISFYSARHTFAVRLLNNGANLKTVADAMGHVNTLTTNKYLKHVNEAKDRATSGLE